VKESVTELATQNNKRPPNRNVLERVNMVDIQSRKLRLRDVSRCEGHVTWAKLESNDVILQSSFTSQVV